MTHRDTIILVVQRDGERDQGLRSALVEWGFEGWFASTYEEGLEKARWLEPKAVLVELDTVERKVVELVQILQATLPGTAIAALIAGDSGDPVGQARAAGLTLTEYFRTPVEAGGLRSWLEAALAD